MTTPIRVGIRVALLLVLLSPVSAFAQDAPKLGIVASSASVVAVHWQFSERFAVRPDFGFAISHNEGAGLGAGSSSSTQSWTPGIAAIFYLTKAENLRTYVSPRYAWSHVHNRTVNPVVTNEANSSTHNLSGTVGAEYAIHRRFAGFGEIGLTYGHSGERSSANVGPSYSVGPRGLAGVIVRF